MGVDVAVGNFSGVIEVSVRIVAVAAAVAAAAHFTKSQVKDPLVHRFTRQSLSRLHSMIRPANYYTRRRSSQAPKLDAEVAKLEDKLGSSTAGLAGLSLTEAFPTRPSYGGKGRKLELWANYFKLQASQDLVLYQYSMSVTPEAAGRKLDQIVRLFLESPEFQTLQSDIATDFRSTLIARQKLSVPSEERKVTYRAEGEDEPRENATIYTMKLDLSKTLSVADLMKYLTSGNLQTMYNEKLMIVQALNILVNHHSKLSNKIANVGSSKSFLLLDAEAQDLEAGLRAIRGFFTSVRAATGRMLLNVNISNTAFFQAGPLDQLIRAFLQSNNRNRVGLANFLNGVRITTNHLPVRKNRSGETIIRAKTIRGLATPNDGYNPDGRVSAHAPRVKEFGAGPRDVQFWLERPTQTAKPSPASKKKPGKAGPAGDTYVSVYDYFKDSKRRHHRTTQDNTNGAKHTISRLTTRLFLSSTLALGVTHPICLRKFV